jgi:hypothetical protein
MVITLLVNDTAVAAYKRLNWNVLEQFPICMYCLGPTERNAFRDRKHPQRAMLQHVMYSMHISVVFMGTADWNMVLKATCH